jgi:transcriptional regulator with XRE-family HTH domain
MPNGRVIRDAAFAERLATASDGHPHIPTMNRGRLTWIQTQFAERFQIKISVESVRKWFSGEARPTPTKMNLLAQLLEVDEAWLSLGITPDMNPNEKKVRNAVVSGAVNLVAGFIQIGGGHPAFPAPNDKKGIDGLVDLYAVIKGAQYAFHVSLAQEVSKGVYRFVVPREYADVTVLGVVLTGPFRCDIVELTADLVRKHEERKGGYSEVEIQSKDGGYMTGRDRWPRITRFDTRLAAD